MVWERLTYTLNLFIHEDKNHSSGVMHVSFFYLQEDKKGSKMGSSIIPKEVASLNF